MTNQLRSPLRSSFRSPFEHRRGGSAPFNPASLASSAFYDRTNLATLFQDSAGTTPVTATAQPIGLELDLSQGLVPLTTAHPPLTGASWTKIALTTSTVAEGTKCIPTAVSSSHRVDKQDYFTVGSANSFFVTAKADGYSWVKLRINTEGVSTGARPANCFVYFNVATGAIGTIGSPFVNPSVVDAGNGFWRVGFTFQVSTSGTLSIQVYPQDLDYGVDFNNWTGDGISGAIVSDVTTSYLPGNHAIQPSAGKRAITAGSPIYADFDAVDDDIVTTFPTSLGAGCTVCRSLPGTGASITTGVTIGTTYTDNVDAHTLQIFTAAQWAALSAGDISKLTAWLNKKAGL